MVRKFSSPEITNVAKVICTSLFLQKFKNCILKFQKILKLNLDMDNIEIYKHAKFQLYISYNMGCTKSDISNSE
jgi:hypothetical protein